MLSQTCLYCNAETIIHAENFFNPLNFSVHLPLFHKTEVVLSEFRWAGVVWIEEWVSWSDPAVVSHAIGEPGISLDPISGLQTRKDFLHVVQHLRKKWFEPKELTVSYLYIYSYPLRIVCLGTWELCQPNGQIVSETKGMKSLASEVCVFLCNCTMCKIICKSYHV